MNTLVLIAKHGSDEAVRLAREIRERLTGKTILAEEHLAVALGWEIQDDATLCNRADLVVVLGGDGTLIHAARLLKGRAVPILGINLGSLGFMTEIREQDALATVEDVVNGQFRTESRMKLTCRLWRDGKVFVDDEVLNDVVINKGALARIADHQMFIDGQLVTTYKSDGVIVSTPTGSTAYSLSAGGPIVHPMVDGIIVTPICSHALTQRPLVLPSDRTIHLDLKSDIEDVYLTLDGKAGYAMKPGDRVEVTRSPNRVLLIRNPRMGYFAILREKLRWGER